MTNLSIDDVIAKNIKNYIECFEKTQNIDGKFDYLCGVAGCQSKYAEKSSAIRHLRINHKEIHNTIGNNKVEESVQTNQSQYVFDLRVKVNPNDILDACAELITMHGLPICSVEYPAFKKILNPYVIALNMKGIKLSISKNSIKEHIKRSSDKIKQIIKEETKNKTVSLMIDIASRYNRSVLGVSISYVHNGKICIRTIGLRVLKASHTAVYIKDILIQILQEYGIRLAQVVSVTSDNGKNMVKAITILDAIYQAQKSESNRKQSDDFAEYDDEYYIDPDIFDDEYYDDLLTEVRASFNCTCSSDLIQSISCGAHCINLVVSHAIEKSPAIKEVISASRTVVKKLRTPTFRSKLKSANLNMAIIDVETRWNSIYSMLERLMKLKPFCDTYELLSEAEWNTVQNIIAILAPFNKYSKKVQSETATLSDFFGYWTMLRIKVSKANDELSKNLLTQMDKYHHLLMKNPTLIAAVYLDPRFQRGVGENKDLAVVFLANLYAKIIEVEAYQDESNTVETIEEKNNEDGSYEELDQYLDACNSAYGVNRTSESSTPNEKEKITTILNDFFGKVQLPLTASVLDFWNEKKDTYPELYKLASVIMAMPPTQTIVERIFSALALVLTSHRTRIGDETLEDILVVRLNNNLLAKSHTEEEAIMRPDDLHFEQTE